MTNRYDTLRYISTYYTFTNGSAAFDTLQAQIPHITVYYICRNILITFVTVLHLITTEWPTESEFIREQSNFIAIYNEWPLVTSNLNGFDITFPSIILEKWHSTNRYDALRYISTYCTFTYGSAAFDTLQLRIPRITVDNICKHIIITFVTVLHLITPQWPMSRKLLGYSRTLSRSNTNDR